jgi:glyoxylase-like metal-dependent hydrolase (beta-lactamase superfamily II)
MSHVEAITVGGTRISTVCEGFAAVTLDGELPVSDVDWSAERASYPWDFHGDDHWRWHVHAFLVETSHGLVIVDTGLGSFPPFRPWTERATDPWSGVDRREVRHVVLTHLHADHAGGTVVDGEPCFPNATYHLHTMDRLHFAEAGDADYVATRGMERLEELGMLETSFDDRRIVAGVRVLHTPGHTPGHRSVLIEDGGEAIVLTGDLFHQPTQIAFADHPGSHDLDVQLGVASRRLILWRAAQRGWGLGVPHFPEPFGTVVDGRWVERTALPGRVG